MWSPANYCTRNNSIVEPIVAVQDDAAVVVSTIPLVRPPELSPPIFSSQPDDASHTHTKYLKVSPVTGSSTHAGQVYRVSTPASGLRWKPGHGERHRQLDADLGSDDLCGMRSQLVVPTPSL
ncbi:hypothetical protein HJFPF1_11234 [Paramyrothecium foliicola]|nr:hypothetical protein HJFPF1_11234 [Paramyrothecium foliicola]